MNARVLPDIQGQTDHRHLAIQRVGIKNLRYPIRIQTAHHTQATIAQFNLSVGLDASLKGTHMSRFIELLEAQTAPIDVHRFTQLMQQMLIKLQANTGTIDMSFPYFIERIAPVSGIKSLLDIQVGWQIHITEQQPEFLLRVIIPATSLCPCSKNISDYGAHNQRSHITLEIHADPQHPLIPSIEDLVFIADESASCPVYGLLKRVDEKYVTERAYDNAKFVEDMVRDAAFALQQHPAISRFYVEVENFESIHNHSAFAYIHGQGLAH